MKMNWKRILTVVLVIAVAVGLGMFGYRQLEYHNGAKTYAEAEQIAAVPSAPASSAVQSAPEAEQPEEAPEETDPYAVSLAEIDLAALREVNDDIIAWIMIPDTQVSYPIVQGSDNDYYLDHTWKGEYNGVGAIFMEQHCAPDFSDFNTIIYGHNMRNGSMFGELRHYSDPAFWQAHPSVYIADGSGVHKYDVFAAHEVGVRTITYGLSIEDEALRQEYIDFTLEDSELDTGIVPTTNDKMLVLSTCTGRGYSTRWVVQAVRSAAE
ncbi:MAG: class B sortase [Butyricicoccus sp.]|nr:class B sortase [Butyricicoccus sp.]